jgi:hypothetical protein
MDPSIAPNNFSGADGDGESKCPFTLLRRAKTELENSKNPKATGKGMASGSGREGVSKMTRKKMTTYL